MATHFKDPLVENDLFISYSRKDIDFARALENALNEIMGSKLE